MTRFYQVPEHRKGKKAYAPPCEWNESGIFVLDDNVSQKDLKYLKEVCGYDIDVIEKPVVQKQVPNVQNKNIQS